MKRNWLSLLFTVAALPFLTALTLSEEGAFASIAVPGGVSGADRYAALLTNTAALTTGRSGGFSYWAPLPLAEGDVLELPESWTAVADAGFLGYALRKEGSDFFHTLGTAFSLGESLSLGGSYTWPGGILARWSLSLLYRPSPLLSLGAVARDPLSGDEVYTLGMGLRPIIAGGWRDRLTLHADIRYADGDWDLPSVGAELEPLDGIILSGGWDFEAEWATASLTFGLRHLRSGAVVSARDDSLSGAAYVHAPFRPQPSLVSSLKRMTVEVDPGEDLREIGAPFRRFYGSPAPTLPEFLREIEDLSLDPRVEGLLFRNASFSTSLAGAQEIISALNRFRQEGKRVIFFFEFPSQIDYLIAGGSGAEIYLHPAGGLMLSGFSFIRPYFGGFLERFGISYINVASHGYKSAFNSFSESAMTDPEREALETVCRGLHDSLAAGLEEGRGERLRVSVRNAIDGGPYLLARDALEAGLVDGLVYNDELEERLEREAASLTENPGEPVQSAAWRGPRLPKVAVISAVGTILSGEIPPYQGIGSETLARAIRTAREDPSVDGILLRIDSGGGSALASEVIAREVALCREGPDAKPVAVSMAGVAASGGYMIAAAAERIFAGSGTITGSIGALAGILNFSALLEAQSIGIDSVTTADGADFASPLLPPDPRDRERLERAVEASYDRFVDIVARGRGLEPAAVEAAAQGRIWTGVQALELGLVDQIGGAAEARSWLARRLGSDGGILLEDYTGAGSPWFSSWTGSVQTALVPELSLFRRWRQEATLWDGGPLLLCPWVLEKKR